MQNLFTIAVQVVLTNPLINLFVYQHIELRKLSLNDFLEMKAKLKPRHLTITDVLTNSVMKFHRYFHH